MEATYRTIVDLCHGCGYILPVGLGGEEEPLCPDCGKDVKLRRDRVQVTIDDAELGEFRELINSRRRKGEGVILNEAETAKMKEYHEEAKRDDS